MMDVVLQYRLITEAVNWVGTPFINHASIKGVGVDCVHLVAALYKFLGTIREFNPPPYEMDGGKHNETSQVIAYIESTGAFDPVPEPMLGEPGDLLCFNIGRVEHHTAVQLTHSCFIHAIQPFGVILSRLDDSTYRKRLTAIYRPKNL